MIFNGFPELKEFFFENRLSPELFFLFRVFDFSGVEFDNYR
jgi:hypothetical protein